MRAATLLLSLATVVLVACTTDDPDPVPENGGAPVVTQIRTGTAVTWEAAAQPSADDLAILRNEFAGEQPVLLVPGEAWSETATVEARVDRFVPDPGDVAASVVVRSDENGDVLASVQRSRVEPLDCEARPDGRFEAVTVRTVDGCALMGGGPVVHLIWNEGGFRWTAESSIYQDAATLIDQVDRWRLLTQDDF